MPQRGRSRRASARQTQLGQRKKKQPKSSSEIPAPPRPPQVRQAGDGSGAISTPPDATRPQPAAPARAFQARQAEPRRTVYQYIVPEIKRILSLSAVIMGIIVVLSFVLR